MAWARGCSEDPQMARALSHNSHTKNRSLDMSDSSKAEGPVRVSEIFNSPDADVVVRSADNIDFRLHKKNLECSTGSFPPADTPVDPKETVHLTESGETLEILFHAIYPRPFPEERMKELKFEPFMLLAEAAEKYAVYSMITACKLYMREVLYPTCTLTIEVDSRLGFGIQIETRVAPKRLRILEFASKYNHQDLINELQSLLVNVPLSELVEILPTNIYKTWSIHRENCLLLGRKDRLPIAKPGIVKILQ